MSSVLAFDASINHGAAVLLDDGKLSRVFFSTDHSSVIKKYGAKGRFICSHVPNSKNFDAFERTSARLVHWFSFFRKVIKEVNPNYIGIEDYAYSASMGSHQLGEIGGVLRIASWLSEKNVRLHDPSTVKMFAAHDGSANKYDMKRAVYTRWPESVLFKDYVHGKYLVIEEDLCDAFAVAQLVWLEVQLRNGLVRLRNLHPKEIQVFNRCTKRYPISLLDREWSKKQ